MAVFQALIDITNKGSNYEDSKELLLKKLDKFLVTFKSNELKLTKRQKQYHDFDEIILLIDFAKDLWDEIIFPKIKKDDKCGIILGKMLGRFLMQTKETLFLLSNNLGLSAISNVRLFMESFAITKYIIDKGDKEAKRFMDFGYYQQLLDRKLPLTPELINEYGEKTPDNNFYYIPYGWCSEEKMNGTKLIEKLKSPVLLDYYRLTCNYIHASPYSLIEITNSEDHYFPIPYDFLIRITRRCLFNFIKLVLSYTMTEEEQKPYLILISMLSPELFNKEESENV